MQYPWFDLVTGDDIQQGDIFERIEVFQIVDDEADEVSEETFFLAKERDVIVMSQSCDIDKDHPKISEVLLCPVWYRSEIMDGYLATHKGMEDARRGNCPRYHVLNECETLGMDREIRVVVFSPVYTLPLAHLQMKAKELGSRIRLLPPYREHLSQAFARFFMRVGLPSDIPPFVGNL